jgi:hypothetical protein
MEVVLFLMTYQLGWHAGRPVSEHSAATLKADEEA